MPSSLAEVPSFAFVFSTRLPVSVCGTVGKSHHCTCFSCPSVLALLVRKLGFAGSPRLQPQSTQRLPLPRAPPTTPLTGTGIFTRCPSPSPPGCGLGPTYPTRTDLPSETLDFQRIGFSPISRYSCQHSLSCSLQCTSQYTFTAHRTLPYHNIAVIPVFGPML